MNSEGKEYLCPGHPEGTGTDPQLGCPSGHSSGPRKSTFKFNLLGSPPGATPWGQPLGSLTIHSGTDGGASTYAQAV